MSVRRKNLKIGVSGVRGIVGETLSPALAADFAASFGGYTGHGIVIVGRDTRPSGEMIENAVVSGLLASGSHVLLAGVVPTPTLQIAVEEYEAAGAIAITASHNPAEWNALKFIDSTAFFLTENGMNALLDIYNQPQDDFVTEQNFRGVSHLEHVFPLHAGKILERVDTEAIRRARFKVAVDCCNGVGALYSKRFLLELGCAEVIPIFEEPDGIFRRKPEPVVANLTELCECVKRNGCHVGFAQDPDGDRISIVNEQGVPLGEQYSTLIPADRVLERTPGPVVANIQTTKALGDIALRYGSEIRYSKVGEVNVAREMLRCNAVFGAEGGSGGILWRDVHLCRDSFSAMALTLEAMALRKQTVSGIMNTLPRYWSATEKLETDAQSACNALRFFAQKYADRKPVLIDGVRLDFEHSWILARQSNTEPVIRIYAESARSQTDAKHLAGSVAGELRGFLVRDGK